MPWMAAITEARAFTIWNRSWCLAEAPAACGNAGGGAGRRDAAALLALRLGPLDQLQEIGQRIFRAGPNSNERDQRVLLLAVVFIVPQVPSEQRHRRRCWRSDVGKRSDDTRPDRMTNQFEMGSIGWVIGRWIERDDECRHRRGGGRAQFPERESRLRAFPGAGTRRPELTYQRRHFTRCRLAERR